MPDDYWKGVAREIKRDRARYDNECARLRHPPFRGFEKKRCSQADGRGAGVVPVPRLPIKREDEG